MMARLMSLFSPGVTWQIGEARLVRVDSEYPPPRFVYWPTSNGPSALLSEPEAREVLAAIILSGDSQRAALLAAIAAVFLEHGVSVETLEQTVPETEPGSEPSAAAATRTARPP